MKKLTAILMGSVLSIACGVVTSPEEADFSSEALNGCLQAGDQLKITSSGYIRETPAGKVIEALVVGHTATLLTACPSHVKGNPFNWYDVSLDGKNGWVRADHLASVSKSPADAGASSDAGHAGGAPDSGQQTAPDAGHTGGTTPDAGQPGGAISAAWDLQIQGRDKSLIVTWIPPATGVATSYHIVATPLVSNAGLGQEPYTNVTASSGVVTVDVAAPAEQTTLTGLVNGTHYDVSIKPFSGTTAGPLSYFSRAVPYATPTSVVGSDGVTYQKPGPFNTGFRNKGRKFGDLKDPRNWVLPAGVTWTPPVSITNPVDGKVHAAWPNGPLKNGNLTINAPNVVVDGLYVPGSVTFTQNAGGSVFQGGYIDADNRWATAWAEGTATPDAKPSNDTGFNGGDFRQQGNFTINVSVQEVIQSPDVWPNVTGMYTGWSAVSGPMSPDNRSSVFIDNRASSPPVIQDTEMNTWSTIAISAIQGVSPAQDSRNYRVYRCNIHDTGDGPRIEGNNQIISTWIHHLFTGHNPLETAANTLTYHSDPLQSTHGSNIVIRGNTVEALDYAGKADFNTTVFLKADQGPIDNVVVDANWLVGGSYSTEYKLGNYSVTHVQHTNNVFTQKYSDGQSGTSGQDPTGNHLNFGNDGNWTNFDDGVTFTARTGNAVYKIDGTVDTTRNVN